MNVGFVTLIVIGTLVICGMIIGVCCYIITPKQRPPELPTLNMILPDIINYIHWCHANRQGQLLFISRDGYLLHKIYKKLYPEYPTQYVYSSRNALHHASPNFVKYTLQFEGTFVDAHGTNNSHCEFYNRLKIDPPPKLLIVPCIARKTCYTNMKSYAPSLQNCYKNSAIEYLLRAPYPSIVDVTENGDPIYESKSSIEQDSQIGTELEMDELWKMYRHIETMARPQLRVFNEYPLSANVISINKSDVVGIAAIDIDNTTLCRDNMSVVLNLIKFIQSRLYKLVIITARSTPWNIPLDKLGITSNIDIYYNSKQTNVEQVKVEQLQHAHTLAGLSDCHKHKSFLLDDTKSIIDAVHKKGFSGLHVNCDTIEKVFSWIP